MPLPALLGANKIISWITDPRNRTLILIILVLLTFGFIGYQYNKIGKLKAEVEYQKTEVTRVENNWFASEDTIKEYVLDNGNLQAQISAYKISYEELQKDYDSIFSEYEYEKNKPPIVVIEYVPKLVEIVREIPVQNKRDSLGNPYVYFKSDTVFNEGNMRSLEVTIPYDWRFLSLPDSNIIPLDDPVYRSMYYNLILHNSSYILKQQMTFTTGLSYDKETERPFIWVETGYPGITISRLVGADIFDDDESRKAFKKAQDAKKYWGLGLHLGVGYQVNKYGFTPGIYIGVGINWTPPILRW